MNRDIPEKEDLENRKKIIESAAEFLNRKPLWQGSNQRLVEPLVERMIDHHDYSEHLKRLNGKVSDRETGTLFSFTHPSAAKEFNKIVKGDGWDTEAYGTDVHVPNKAAKSIGEDASATAQGSDIISPLAKAGKHYWNRFMNDFGKPNKSSDPTHPDNKKLGPVHKPEKEKVGWAQQNDQKKPESSGQPSPPKVDSAPKAAPAPARNGENTIDRASQAQNSNSTPVADLAKLVPDKPKVSPTSSGHSAPVKRANSPAPVKTGSSGHSLPKAKPLGDVAQTAGVTATMSKSADGSSNYVNRGSNSPKGIPTSMSIAAQRAKGAAKTAVSPAFSSLSQTSNKAASTLGSVAKHSDAATSNFQSANATLDKILARRGK